MIDSSRGLYAPVVANDRVENRIQAILICFTWRADKSDFSRPRLHHDQLCNLGGLKG